MKKVCSRCGSIILHNSKCGCKPLDNRRVSDEKRRFYSSYAWRILTTEYLQGHHVKSFKDYPELRLDEENIVVLCRTCNLQIGDSNTVDWQ